MYVSRSLKVTHLLIKDSKVLNLVDISEIRIINKSNKAIKMKINNVVIIVFFFFVFISLQRND